jgi:hypothetical protein
MSRVMLQDKSPFGFVPFVEEICRNNGPEALANKCIACRITAHVLSALDAEAGIASLLRIKRRGDACAA